MTMKLSSLYDDIAAHKGQFLCERIHKAFETKIVQFCHVITPPSSEAGLPEVGRLRDFYDTFGSITFYVDPISGDAAKHITNPVAWPELDTDFRGWFNALGEEERSEILPEWIDDCLVIGEEPRTGNYILMPTSGESAGRVFLFDHDGYEFTEKAGDLVEYTEQQLTPDDSLLTEIATHMRFIDGNPGVQWWIRELRDNRGNEARTSA